MSIFFSLKKNTKLKSLVSIPNSNPSLIWTWYVFLRTLKCLQIICVHLISSVQSVSHVWLFVTPWSAAHQASIINSQSSCPLSPWCHPTISSSVVPFSCLQSFLALGSFPISPFFASGGQSIGASASTSVLPKNIQDWFPLGLIVLRPKDTSCCNIL